MVKTTVRLPVSRRFNSNDPTEMEAKNNTETCPFQSA